MAYTNKNAENGAAKKENTKKATSDSKEVKNLQEQNAKLTEQNAALEAKVDMLTKMFMEFQKQNSVVSTPAVELAPIKSAWDDSYTIVHLVENIAGATTHIELSNITMDFSVFGEERLLDRRQCEELAGKYRKWFKKGIIAFGADAEELAEKFGLKSIKDYGYLSKDFISKLGSLSNSELEELYNKVAQGHKDFIIQYFKRKIVEKDPAFKNIHKIEMLNRVSDGAMSNVLLDLQREKEQAAK